MVRKVFLNPLTPRVPNEKPKARGAVRKRSHGDTDAAQPWRKRDSIVTNTNGRPAEATLAEESFAMPPFA